MAEPARALVSAIKDSREALASFGAVPGVLGADQLAELDHKGYLALVDVLDGETVEMMRTWVDKLAAQVGTVGKGGETWLDNLVDGHAVFDKCWNSAELLSAVAHVLGWQDLKLYSLKARIVPPGCGGQPLHFDWAEPVGAGDYQICNSVWPLDAFTARNGATRVVPGSHRWGRRPADPPMTPSGEPVKEVVLDASAGSCVVFNSHVWHGGTRNSSAGQRRVLLASFVRRHHEQQVVQRDRLSDATLNRLNASQRYLLDV